MRKLSNRLVRESFTNQLEFAKTGIHLLHHLHWQKSEHVEWTTSKERDPTCRTDDKIRDLVVCNGVNCLAPFNLEGVAT
jgi:hypothetical protein